MYRYMIGETTAVSYVPTVSPIQLQYKIEELRIELSDEMSLTASLNFNVSPQPEPMWWFRPLFSLEDKEEHVDCIQRTFADRLQATLEDRLHWSAVSVIRIRR